MLINLKTYFDILAVCSILLVIFSGYFALKAERYKRKFNHLLNNLTENQYQGTRQLSKGAIEKAERERIILKFKQGTKYKVMQRRDSGYYENCCHDTDWEHLRQALSKEE